MVRKPDEGVSVVLQEVFLNVSEMSNLLNNKKP